jgi:hypothetical protein
MGDEKKVRDTIGAVIFGAGSFALDRSVWAFHQIGIDFPPWLKTLVAYSVILSLLVSAVFFVHLAWLWIRGGRIWQAARALMTKMDALGLFSAFPARRVTFYDDGRLPVVEPIPARPQGIAFFVASMLFCGGIMWLVGWGAFAILDQYKYGPNPTVFLPARSEWRGREFVLLNLEQLTGYYRDFTEGQAKRLVEPYIGRWVAVSGAIDEYSVQDMGGVQFSYETVVLKSVPFEHQGAMLIFGYGWRKFLDGFNRNDVIAAYCKVQGVGEYSLFLDSCELAAPPNAAN